MNGQMRRLETSNTATEEGQFIAFLFQSRKSKKYSWRPNHLLPSPTPQTIFWCRTQLHNELFLIKIPTLWDLVAIEEPLKRKMITAYTAFPWLLNTYKNKQLPILCKHSLLTSLRVSLFPSCSVSLGRDRIPSPIFHCLNFNSFFCLHQGAMISKSIHFRLQSSGTIICSSLAMGASLCK